MKSVNPLESMTVEERFHAAFLALLQMEARAERAELQMAEWRELEHERYYEERRAFLQKCSRDV